MPLPERVPCTCGELEGYLVLKKGVIEVHENGYVHKLQPSEFEAQAGRGAAKKWKTSVKVGRVPGHDCYEGKEIGMYLRDVLGVDISRGVLIQASSSKTAQTTSKSVPNKPLGAKGDLSKPSVPKLSCKNPLLSKDGSRSIKSLPSLTRDGSKSFKAPQPSVKLTLAERLKRQLESHAMCFEVATPAGFAGNGGEETASATIRRSENPHTPLDMVPVHDLLKIQIKHGKPEPPCRHVIDLETISSSYLHQICKETGDSDAIMREILLDEVPTVPKSKLSSIHT